MEYRVFAPKTSKKNTFTTDDYSIRSFPFFLYPECRDSARLTIHKFDLVRTQNVKIYNSFQNPLFLLNVEMRRPSPLPLPY